MQVHQRNYSTFTRQSHTGFINDRGILRFHKFHGCISQVMGESGIPISAQRGPELCLDVPLHFVVLLIKHLL
jgi:hypothetical protein